MKFFKSRLTLAALLALLLCLSLAACGGGEEETPDGSGETAYGSDLASLEGWWYMPADYSDGIHIMEIFYLDAADESYAAYNEFGNVVFEGAAWIDDEGDLGLELDIFGDIYLTPGYDGLYDEEGKLAFVLGAPLEAEDTSALTGRWYRDADTMGDYYELYDDGSFRMVAVATEYTDEYVMNEGDVAVSRSTVMYQVGESVEEMRLVFGDDTFAPEATLSPSQTLFWLESFGDTEIYVHEDALGLPEAEAELAWTTIHSQDWRAEDDASYLNFFPNGWFEISESVEDDEGWITFETTDSGEWSILHGMLYLDWGDAGEENCAIADTLDSFYSAYLNMTFYVDGW